MAAPSSLSWMVKHSSTKLSMHFHSCFVAPDAASQGPTGNEVVSVSNPDRRRLCTWRQGMGTFQWHGYWSSTVRM